MIHDYVRNLYPNYIIPAKPVDNEEIMQHATLHYSSSIFQAILLVLDSFILWCELIVPPSYTMVIMQHLCSHGKKF